MQLDQAIYYVGVISSLYLLAQLAQHIYTYTHPSSLPRYLHSNGSCKERIKGSWALITGATDGIGLGFAQELCSRGFNVILHGRNREKLRRVQQQLSREYPASKTRIVVFDAGGPTDSLDRMVREFGGWSSEDNDYEDEINLTVLINNVGGMRCLSPGSAPYPDLNAYPACDLDRVLNLNARFTAQLTRLLLPTLTRNAPSLVMNISSAATMGIPYIPVYAGAKGFLESFTRAVKGEMVARGVDVEVLGIRVGNVNSAGNQIQVGLCTPTSRRMAKAALGRVGCGRMVVWGYWPHAMQLAVFGFLHEWVFQRVVIGQMKMRIREEEKEARLKGE